MARIIYTAIVESIRGSIAGTTFQRNKHGYTIKKKPNMINPNTRLQNQRKTTFSQVARSWRDLTQSQRDLYDTFASTFPQYAKHNQSSQLGGFSVFVRYNALSVMANHGLRTTPGTTIPPVDTLSITVTNDSGVLKINLSSVEEGEDWAVLFFMSRPFSASKKFIGTAPRYVALGYSATQSFTITDEYIAMYGAVPAVGDQVAIDILPIADNASYVLSRDSQIYTVGVTP